jgi:hypothetical protein
MGEAVLQSLVKKHNKTGAQILIRWSIQKASYFCINDSTGTNLLGIYSPSKIGYTFENRRKRCRL